MKTLQQRVRAQIEKAARDAKRAEDAKVSRVSNATISREVRREERIDALISGDAIPRNAKEQAIQDRAMFDDLSNY